MNYTIILGYARRMRKNPTPAEHFVWEKVRNRRFLGKKFYRQYIIQHEEINGVKRFFIADFYCHESKLIVEIDGEIHKAQKEYDEIREDILQQMGFQIIRFSNEEVLNRWDSVERKLTKGLDGKKT